MSGKRKKTSTVVRIVRPHLTQEPVTNRATTVYRGINGRLGQQSNAHYGDDEGAMDTDGPNGHSGPWSPLFFTSLPAENMDDVPDVAIPGLDIPATQSAADRDGDGEGDNQDKAHSSLKTPIQQWLPYRQAYLDEYIRYDSRLGLTSCGICSAEPALYRCKDCFSSSLYCLACLLSRHQRHPLHRVLVWNDCYFEDTSLANLGLEIQLGHYGNACQHAGDIEKNFVVIDTSGIHSINLRFCECNQNAGASHHRTQLLRVGWLPATSRKPTTAFTYDVLDTFQLLTLQGKVSAYDFYLSLHHKSDNTGTVAIPERLEQFMNAIRIHRNLKLAKRSGRGHDPAGVDATHSGQCAIECPACPHPNRNLPADWEGAPPSKSWLYSQVVTIDANFRLKNRDRPTHETVLSDGWAHWVPSAPYFEYVKQYGHQIEPNHCDSELRAVDHASSKRSKGFRATGVGGAFCGRHGLVRKNGLGDLQKGERYANMDFIVFYSLIGLLVSRLIISYDIVCQWYRNLRTRMTQYPMIMRLSSHILDNTTFVIPKFHIYGHGVKCQDNFSLNFLPFSAETNGEDPERFWANANPSSMSTILMGVNARHEALDDVAGAWNWRKICDFGVSLANQFRQAILMRAKHQASFEKFSSSLPANVVASWEAMVLAWEANPKCRNPFTERIPKSTLAEVRLEMAQEEMEDNARGVSPMHEMSPHNFLVIGLELEEEQRDIRRLAAGREKTTHQAVEIQEQRNRLYRRILAWRQVQRLYMSSLFGSVLQGTESTADSAKPEATTLFLPSQVQPPTADLISLRDKECRLRIAQADDALMELKRLLRVTTGLWQYKWKQAGFSQDANTRARSVIDRFREKVYTTAERYCVARKALFALDPNGAWQLRLQDLKPEDIQGPQRDIDSEESENRREISWIWMTGSTSAERRDITSDDIGDSLRVEWAKSRARAARWSEEVQLLVEEMRRILAFLNWKCDAPLFVPS